MSWRAIVGKVTIDALCHCGDVSLAVGRGTDVACSTEENSHC